MVTNRASLSNVVIRLLRIELRRNALLALLPVIALLWLLSPIARHLQPIALWPDRSTDVQSALQALCPFVAGARFRDNGGCSGHCGAAGELTPREVEPGRSGNFGHCTILRHQEENKRSLNVTRIPRLRRL